MKSYTYSYNILSRINKFIHPVGCIHGNLRNESCKNGSGAGRQPELYFDWSVWMREIPETKQKGVGGRGWGGVSGKSCEKDLYNCKKKSRVKRLIFDTAYSNLNHKNYSRTIIIYKRIILEDTYTIRQ